MCCICGLSTTRSCCLFSPSRATKTTTHTMRTFTVRELESPLSNPLRLLMVPAPQERMNRLAHHPALCFRRCHASTSSKPPGTRHLCTGSTASPSPTLMWATSVRKASVSRPTVLDRASRPPLSLSLSRARARAIKPIQPRAPAAPRPAARSKAVLDLRPSSFLFSLRFRLVGGPPRDLYLAPEPRISSRFSPLAVWKN